MRFLASIIAAVLPALASGTTIAQINGDAFISPLINQAVTNVTGYVIAKSSSGIFLRSNVPDNNNLTSEAIYVYSNTIGSTLAVGDLVMLDGKVSEYIAASSPDNLYLTEITSPKNLKITSRNNAVSSHVIGEDTAFPPTTQYSVLDGGDIFSLPNNRSQVSVANPKLSPSNYGLDFWESLNGQLVTIRGARAVTRPNRYGDTWVTGANWPTTNANTRGGLTMAGSDLNPETILIGSPLDTTRNAKDTRMGDSFGDITGVVTYSYGFYRILPLTAPKVVKPVSGTAPPTKLVSTGKCAAITMADYNVANLMPTSAHLPKIASHIVNFLRMPDLIFLQEIQDNSGSRDDGVISANVTLSTLSKAIATASNDTVNYAFAVVDTDNDTDGGQPGGNIRVAFLYNPKVLQLAGGLRQGGPADKNEVIAAPRGKEAILKYNPGRIDPANPAWTESRKPIAAHWELVSHPGQNQFFTVNLHWASKGGSSSLHGNWRTPINGVVDRRIAMANVTASFIKSILSIDKNAAIVAAGDFNEFDNVAPLKQFVSISGMKDADEVVGTPANERYTYIFDMNSQALDHMFVSPSLQKVDRLLGYEHVHVNTWDTDANAASDHDPSVTLVNVCGN